MKRELVRGPLDLLILSILRTGAAHGYAIIGALSERSGGAFNMEAGTIYPALHRLERHGLVSAAWDAPSGRRRRFYALTQDGREALVAREIERKHFESSIDKVLSWEGGN